MDSIALNPALYLRTHSPWQCCGAVLRRLGFRCYKRTLGFYSLDLEDFHEPVEPSCGLHVASIAEVEERESYHDGWQTKERALRRLRSGAQLFVLEEGAEWVYFHWLETGRVQIRYLDLRFKLPPDTAYSTCLYTVPRYRGQGIAYRAETQILAHLKSRGFKQVVVVIDPSNKSSIGLHHKLGFSRYQLANYCRFWFIKYFRVSAGERTRVAKLVGLFASPPQVWKAFLASIALEGLPLVDAVLDVV